MSDNPYTRAKQILRERGWSRGGSQKSDSQVCILAACAAATGLEPYEWSDLDPEIVEPLRRIIEEQYGVPQRKWVPQTPSTTAWIWNDDVAQSIDEVETVLDKAAVAWDERV